ncbi:MAG: hypothetical protein AUJ71_00255 [Candidatus Omnitrophica bacterium CG1_02_49_16]|nr:MAG: hypothetical protein AUJ71_00255 [Candidatus Omnitrophica bacterium CG1_02_49_16]
MDEVRLKRTTMSRLSFGSIFGRFAFLKRTAQKRIKSPRKMAVSFTLVNRILLAAVVVALVYVASDTLASALSLTHPSNILPQKEKGLRNLEGKVSPLKEASYYLQKMNSRDIFKEYKEGETKKEKKEAKPIEENDAVKNLALVGISWSADPDVIIEDKAAQRTYFVKRGQRVGNNVKVNAVFKDKVILSIDDQEFELR